MRYYACGVSRTFFSFSKLFLVHTYVKCKLVAQNYLFFQRLHFNVEILIDKKKTVKSRNITRVVTI